MKKSYGSGRQTLRFKSNGEAKVEEVDDIRTAAEDKINQLLENFLGINDAELSKLKHRFQKVAQVSPLPEVREMIRLDCIQKRNGENICNALGTIICQILSLISDGMSNIKTLVNIS